MSRTEIIIFNKSGLGQKSVGQKLNRFLIITIRTEISRTEVFTNIIS